MLKVAAEHTVPVQVCVCINRGRREGEGVSRRSSFFGAQVMPVSLTLPQVQSSAERSSGKKNRFSWNVSAFSSASVEDKFVGYIASRSLLFSTDDRHRCGCHLPSRTRHRASTSTRWHLAFALCCHNIETRAPITNTPNSTQLAGTPYHSPSYIRVRAVVWACGDGQAHKHTDRHTDARWSIYISRRIWLTRNVLTTIKKGPAYDKGLTVFLYLFWWTRTDTCILCVSHILHDNNGVSALHLAPTHAALQLLNGTLFLQRFECVPIPTVFVVILGLGISSRPSNPLTPSFLCLRFGVCWTVCEFINYAHLLTYLLTYSRLWYSHICAEKGR